MFAVAFASAAIVKKVEAGRRAVEEPGSISAPDPAPVKFGEDPHLMEFAALVPPLALL